MSKSYRHTEIPNEHRSQTEELSFILHRYHKTHCQMFFSRMPRYALASLVYLILFVAVGLTHGYERSVHIIMQSKRATMQDLSNFSLSNYPYILKVFIAPFLDRYYFKAFGRSKTYICTFGILLSVLYMVIASRMDGLMKEKKFSEISAIFFVMNCLLVVFQIACTTWVLTLFKKEQRSKATFIKVMGHNIGEFLTFNIFVPLNSVQWVRVNFYPKERVKQGLLLHNHMCWLICVCLLLVVIFIGLFVAERKIKGEEEVHLCKVVMFVPKMLTRKNTLILLGYLAGIRVIEFMLGEVVSYRMINCGISKDTIVMIDTILFPLSIAVSLLCHRFLNKGVLLQTAHWLTLMAVISNLSKYFMVAYLEQNKHMAQYGVIWVFINHLLMTFVVPLNCIIAFFNTISDVRVGSTMLTALTAYTNLLAYLPKTLGLFVAQRVNFHYFVLGFQGVQLVLLVLLYRTAKYLDSLESWDFSTYVSDHEMEQLKSNAEHRPGLDIESNVRMMLEEKSGQGQGSDERLLQTVK